MLEYRFPGKYKMNTVYSLMLEYVIANNITYMTFETEDSGEKDFFPFYLFFLLMFLCHCGKSSLYPLD